MATATEIATRALRRLGVIDALEQPSSADVVAATEALNAMIASWEADGLSGDVLPLDQRFEQAVVAMLAVRLSEEYGKQPGPVLAGDAEKGWRQMVSAFSAVKPQTFDIALQCGVYGYHALEVDTEPVDYNLWVAATAYSLRAMVYHNSNVYECTTAGTSGSTGPSGTGSDIADGTAQWVWRRVAA